MFKNRFKKKGKDNDQIQQNILENHIKENLMLKDTINSLQEECERLRKSKMNLMEKNSSLQTELVTQNMKPQEIDEILDEIDEEQKTDFVETKVDEKRSEVDWDNIIEQLKLKNLAFIKNKISSREMTINEKNPQNGKTLLIYASIIGDYDLVKNLCNFGANASIVDNDGQSALDFSIKFGRYNITELLWFRSLSGTLGNDLKQIASNIHQKNKEAQYMMDADNELCNKLIEFIIVAIKQQADIDASILYYAWYFNLKQHEKHEEKSVLESKLWISMMETFENILGDTNNKSGWSWVKQQFANSLIWFLPHPHNTKRDNDQLIVQDEEMGQVLKRTLFYELLHRVRKETKRQSDLLLKQKIDFIKNKSPLDWKDLTEFNVISKHSHTDARQDVMKCLKPDYNENDLSEEKFPSSVHFSAAKHYDTAIYLNKLIFNANLMDSVFQNDMQQITKQIGDELREIVKFRMGPVKTIQRSTVKVENDYINEKYPRSARILDINRCALQFKDPKTMLNFIHLFMERIKNGKAKCVKQVIRCKNGWNTYDRSYPQYTDIKLNCLIATQSNQSIIVEIQFLLDLMSSFKKKAHKLYSIERKYELVYNFQQLKDKMENFKDVEDIMVIWKQSVSNDDVLMFRNLWESIFPTIELLFDKNETNMYNQKTMLILLNKTGKIYEYLQQNKHKKLFSDSILLVFNQAMKSGDTSWHGYLNELSGQNFIGAPQFMNRFLNLFDDRHVPRTTNMVTPTNANNLNDSNGNVKVIIANKNMNNKKKKPKPPLPSGPPPKPKRKGVKKDIEKRGSEFVLFTTWNG
eukprot:91136_1